MTDVLTTFFGTFEIVFLCNIALCLVAGVVIGLERESRGKDAGVSTHTLVIMGAMLFTYISAFIEQPFETRIAAQIVTGIGFLGAGLILKQGTAVHNLTTAASLWFAAAIGMAFGFGLYTIGIVATIASVITLRIPHMFPATHGTAVAHIDKEGE